MKSGHQFRLSDSGQVTGPHADIILRINLSQFLQNLRPKSLYLNLQLINGSELFVILLSDYAELKPLHKHSNKTCLTLNSANHARICH